MYDLYIMLCLYFSLYKARNKNSARPGKKSFRTFAVGADVTAPKQ